MPIISLTVGFLYTNCYIVICEETRESLIIDPGFTGDEMRRILSEIRKNRLRIKYIVNTHGHADHISGNTSIKRATGAILAAHCKDAEMLIDPAKNLSLMLGLNVVSPPPDIVLRGEEEIEVGRIKLKVLHTPGHTPGSISLYCRDLGAVFTGDSLFAGSIGRADFPGSSCRDLLLSIREKILALPDETVVYPGHGESTTISVERRSNPFLL
ncbi:MAG: MBL fold metallo-hydrolase [Candidatus Bathyarchaeia archaeon]|nr:MBL fold metallo-hydrolase [Candidatus Bathyarchaeota archaeon]